MNYKLAEMRISEASTLKLVPSGQYFVLLSFPVCSSNHHNQCGRQKHVVYYLICPSANLIFLSRLKQFVISKNTCRADSSA